MMRRVGINVSALVILIGLAFIATGTGRMLGSEAFLVALLIGSLVVMRPHKKVMAPICGQDHHNGAIRQARTITCDGI